METGVTSTAQGSPGSPDSPGSQGLQGAGAAIRPWYLAATSLGTLTWLVRLRWTSVALHVAVLAFSAAFSHVDFPLRRLAWFVAAAALVNALRARWLDATGTTPRTFDGLGLVIDAMLLTGLLELTGGPFNPFGVIFIVQIALAVVTLGRLPAVGQSLLALVCIGLLVYWHTTETDPEHHRLNDFPTHLFTMWVAAAVIVELVAYFVLQASNALSRREQELDAMRRQAARTERLIAMTTLAAGAAHELSTPLATIALASRELEHTAARGSTPGLVDDARLIRAEVDRCRAILDQMSGRAGGVATDNPDEVTIAAVIDDVRARLTVEQRERLLVRIDPSVGPLRLPRTGFGQALVSLITNAFDATAEQRPASDAPVRLEARQLGTRLQVYVRDSGTGMAPHLLERVGEPFFTTKEAGRGLGLGVFLARIFAERAGGSLSLDADQGTTVTLDLPVRMETGGAR